MFGTDRTEWWITCEDSDLPAAVAKGSLMEGHPSGFTSTFCARESSLEQSLERISLRSTPLLQICRVLPVPAGWR